MVLGSTPHPLPTEPLRDVRSVKTGVPGGDRGAVRERSLARASSLGPNRRMGNRRRRLMREGTRSRRPHRSFARRCGRRDLGCFERLRGPLPVLESARQRRRVLGRCDDPGWAATLSLLGPVSARPPPAVRDARLHEAGRWSQDHRLDVGRDRDSRIRPRVVTSCRSRRATSASGAHAANTVAGEWG